MTEPATRPTKDELLQVFTRIEADAHQLRLVLLATLDGIMPFDGLKKLSGMVEAAIDLRTELLGSYYASGRAFEDMELHRNAFQNTKLGPPV